MKLNQKFCEPADIVWIKQHYTKEIDVFPHKADDCIFKSFAIYDYILNDYFGPRNKIIDCGAAQSPLGLLFSPIFDRVEVIDNEQISEIKKENVFPFLSDFFDYFPQQPDESYDVVVDCCAMTHFAFDEISNYGLRRIANLIKKKLRKTGVFIMSSDVLSSTAKQTNTLKQYILPSEIINIFFAEGLILTSQFNYQSDNDVQVVKVGWNGIENFVLNYCNFVFQNQQ